jgi:hypothetical protein
MKKVHKTFIFTLILLGFMALSQISLAQFPPPPPTAKGGDTNQGIPGGGAPIGSGVVILITLAAGYGGKKVYDFKGKIAD